LATHHRRKSLGNWNAAKVVEATRQFARIGARLWSQPTDWGADSAKT